MKTVKDYKFQGKRVLVRVDFNVPLDEDMNVTDATRIRATVPTIETIMENEGRPVLMSHLGRPGGDYDEKFSLSHVVAKLETLLQARVHFTMDCVGKEAEEASKKLKKGEVLLLENLRFHKGETKGDKEFARELAKNGDFYVNDAFGTAHRAHASTAVIAEFFPNAKCFGFVMANEIENVNKVLNAQSDRVTAIVGGAKVSSKIAILENLIPKLNDLIIAGGMAFTFIKAMGGKIGDSLVEDDFLDTAKEVLKKARENGTKIHLPLDSVNANSFSNEADRKITAADNIEEGWMGLDVGPQTLNELEPVILNSATILWNGPMGVFEFSNFEKGTREVAALIARATANGTFSVVGGGDSVAAVKKFGMDSEVSYVSTGGGAMLEYLEGKTLPGIKAILD